MKFFPYEVVIVLSEDVHLTEDVPGLMAVHHHHLVSPRVGTLTPKLRGVTVVVLHCDLWKNVFAVVFSETHIYNVGFFFLFTYTKLLISNFRRISYIQYVFVLLNSQIYIQILRWRNKELYDRNMSSFKLNVDRIYFIILNYEILCYKKSAQLLYLCRKFPKHKKGKFNYLENSKILLV